MQTFKFLAPFLLLMAQNASCDQHLLELDMKTFTEILKEGKDIKVGQETDVPPVGQLKKQMEKQNKKVVSECLAHEVKYFNMMVEIEEKVDYLLSKGLQWKTSILEMLKNQRHVKSEGERLISELNKLSNSKMLEKDELIKLQNEVDKLFEDNLKIQKQTRAKIMDVDLILKVREELNGLISKHKSMGSEILSNEIFLKDELGIKRLSGAKAEVRDLYVKANDFDIKVLEKLSKAYKEVEKLNAAVKIEMDTDLRNKLRMETFFLINDKIPSLITDDLYLKFDGELIFRTVAAYKKHKEIEDLFEEISDLQWYYDNGEEKVAVLIEQFEELMLKLEKYKKTEL